jgi:hypothetical protein
LCSSGGDDFEEVDEDENIDELDQQEVRTFREVPVFMIYRYWYPRFWYHACRYNQDCMGSDPSL